MSPKPAKQTSKSEPTSSTLTSFYKRTAQSSSPNQRQNQGRDGLGAYLADPGSQAAAGGGRVVFWDDEFVAIQDLYPKASVHCLLLVRDPVLRRRHPFDAFGGPPNDPDPDPASAALLAAARPRAARLKSFVAKELQRRFGPFSRLDARREAVLSGEEAVPDPDPVPEAEVNASDGTPSDQQHQQQQQQRKLPPGRDWEAEVLVGVHAHPSMNDLHVHVVSRDLRSPSLRHRRHYNAFATPFLVPLADLPLAADDPRRHPGRDGEGYLAADLRCWRCGANFGNRFARLKEHLEVEFDAWKRQ